MGVGPRLDLRTTTSLVVSQQLQTAIRLLTLTNLELEAEIHAELERNPLLELADEEGAGAPTPEAAASAQSDDALHTLDRDLGPDGAALGAGDEDVDYLEERFHHDSAADTGRPGETGEAPAIEALGSEAPGLVEVLEAQAGAALSGTDLAIARHLIGLLDEAGYLTEPLEEVAARLGIALEHAERVLGVIQTFEPTGVGARSLAECLAIQAREADRYDPCMQALIANLDLVARGDLARLRRVCEVDEEDLRDMLAELRGYNPKPGLVHGSGRVQPVVPDVLVRRGRHGLVVELNTATLPRLIVNRRYQAELSAHAGRGNGRQRSERQFLDRCVSQAQWLVRALDQRASTILKVATEIVREQEGFFEHGVSHLRPLTMRAIAESVQMHESTVSRVVANKSLACDRGIFDMRTFFTHAIHASHGGEDASAVTVRARVKALIDAEDPLKPLSDDQLVQLLQAEGHDIARRTVAKYREILNIPSSFDRRRRARVHAA